MGKVLYFLCVFSFRIEYNFTPRPNSWNVIDVFSNTTLFAKQ